jgi:hypothetical protein
MKNIPDVIYLQIGDDCLSDDFDELVESGKTEVTLCKGKIDSNYIKYLRAIDNSDVQSKIAAMLERHFTTNSGQVNDVRDLQLLYESLRQLLVSP